MANTYVQGALVRIPLQFVDPSNNPFDPTGTIGVNYAAVGGAITRLTYAGGGVVKDAPGVYHADIDTTNLVGTIAYRRYATGQGQSAREDYFIVAGSVLI